MKAYKNAQNRARQRSLFLARRRCSSESCNPARNLPASLCHSDSDFRGQLPSHDLFRTLHHSAVLDLDHRRGRSVRFRDNDRPHDLNNSPFVLPP